ncbi:hypothetical protein PGQ11_007955 [Apiospora arundinis]|uniref:Uncharacterized protein n=1 Tax=Apiospora arundinis TaxID=335852 RepID=A0ABR2IX72_9PEZI
MPNTPALQAGALLTIPGILMRIVLKGTKLEEYSTSMASMDQSLQIIKNMWEEYAKPKLQPRVHAEIQVLEQFHKAELQFLVGDRYIGCSKPACQCCLL